MIGLIAAFMIWAFLMAVVYKAEKKGKVYKSYDVLIFI